MRADEIARRGAHVAYGAHHAAERFHRLQRPNRGVLQPRQVGRRGEDAGGVDLVEGEETAVVAGDGLVAPAEAEARHANALLQVLADVPALEMRQALRGTVVPDGENARHATEARSSRVVTGRRSSRPASASASRMRTISAFCSL